MSEERLTAITRAFKDFRMDDARALIDEELAERPNAEVYYLASLAARNHGQRLDYLRKTLEHDPDHVRAREELADAKPPDVAAEPAPAAERPETEASDEPRLASLTRRFCALFIDACIIFSATSLILAANDSLAPLAEAFYSMDDFGATAVYREFQRHTILINLALSAVYHMSFMVVFNGQTPGKMVYRLRVLRQDGQRITAWDAVTRNVLGYALSQTLLIGYLYAYLDEDQQTWHDKMANTIVVDESPRDDADAPAD